MAEAITIVGVIASVASLIDYGSKVIARLHDLSSGGPQAPPVFQDAANQLPLLLEITKELEARIHNHPVSPESEKSLARTVDGCVRQISQIDKIIAKCISAPGESGFKRVRKAVSSVHNEHKITKALKILETYKTTIHMYSSTSMTESSMGVKPYVCYDLPCRQVPRFIGRHDTLDKLARHLESNAVTTSDQRIVVLIGMGGQGKTQIALKYSQRAKASLAFDYIYWVDASSENSLLRSYGKIAAYITSTNVAFPDDRSRMLFVMDFFARSNDKWLFILDNYDRP